ncbi:hypothetical protein D3C80_1620120 [compost metagenome]
MSVAGALGWRAVGLSSEHAGDQYQGEVAQAREYLGEMAPGDQQDHPRPPPITLTNRRQARPTIQPVLPHLK